MDLIIPRDWIKGKECYMNIWKVYLANRNNFNDYHVCIGLVGYASNPNILYRHCYIVDKSLNVVYDSVVEYLKELPDKYYHIHVFQDNEIFFNEIMSSVRNIKSNGDIDISSLMNLIKDSEIKYFEENNIGLEYVGHHIVIPKKI